MALPQEKIVRPTPQDAQPDLTREYVAGNGSAWSGRIGQVLSNFTDDLEWMIGLDVYERMSRDPVVSKNLQFQKLSVTSDAIELHPAIQDKNDPEYAQAIEIRDFHQRSLAGLHRPLPQIIGEMMAALKRGHTVAEITYKEPVPNGRDPYKLLLKSLKVKPRNTTAFVIDPYRNVIGLTAWVWNRQGLVSSSQIDSGSAIIPKEKFAILAFETEDEDPRGIISLRPAYNFWQAKCLLPGLHLKWMEKSGIPSVVGFTSQYSNVEGDAQSGVKTAEEAMADSLAGLDSGAVAAFPFGAKIEKVEVSGTGVQFSRGYEDFDRQIDYAQTLQSGATKDSQKGSFSSKTVMKDVLDILIWSRKHAVAQVIFGVLQNGTRYNFGDDKVHLTPDVVIGDEEGRDWAADAEALAKLAPYLTDSQWLALCAEMGIAAPTDTESVPTRKAAAPVATAPTEPADPNAQDDPPADPNAPKNEGNKQK